MNYFIISWGMQLFTCRRFLFQALPRCVAALQLLRVTPITLRFPALKINSPDPAALQQPNSFKWCFWRPLCFSLTFVRLKRNSSEIPSQVLVRPWSLAVRLVTWARYRPSNFYSGSSIVLVFLVHHCTGCCGQPEEHLLLVGTEGSDRRRSRGRGGCHRSGHVRAGQAPGTEFPECRYWAEAPGKDAGAAVCAFPVEQGAAGGTPTGKAEGSQRTS